MLATLKALFTHPPSADSALTAAESQRRLALASAALLLEVCRADFQDDPREKQAVLNALQRQFPLSATELAELRALAEERVEHSVSLHEFTELVNGHYTPAQKGALIGAMWQVAYADGDLDKYEEYLIRKVADLIYVPHSEFIRQKLLQAPPHSAG